MINNFESLEDLVREYPCLNYPREASIVSRMCIHSGIIPFKVFEQTINELFLEIVDNVDLFEQKPIQYTIALGLADHFKALLDTGKVHPQTEDFVITAINPFSIRSFTKRLQKADHVKIIQLMESRGFDFAESAGVKMILTAAFYGLSDCVKYLISIGWIDRIHHNMLIPHAICAPYVPAQKKIEIIQMFLDAGVEVIRYSINNLAVAVSLNRPDLELIQFLMERIKDKHVLVGGTIQPILNYYLRKHDRIYEKPSGLFTYASKTRFPEPQKEIVEYLAKNHSICDPKSLTHPHRDYIEYCFNVGRRPNIEIIRTMQRENIPFGDKEKINCNCDKCNMCLLKSAIYRLFRCRKCNLLKFFQFLEAEFGKSESFQSMLEDIVQHYKARDTDKFINYLTGNNRDVEFLSKMLIIVSKKSFSNKRRVMETLIKNGAKINDSCITQDLDGILYNCIARAGTEGNYEILEEMDAIKYLLDLGVAFLPQESMVDFRRGFTDKIKSRIDTNNIDHFTYSKFTRSNRTILLEILKLFKIHRPLLPFDYSKLPSEIIGPLVEMERTIETQFALIRLAVNPFIEMAWNEIMLVPESKRVKLMGAQYHELDPEIHDFYGIGSPEHIAQRLTELERE